MSTSASAPITTSAAISSTASAQAAESTIECQSSGLTDSEKTGVGVGVVGLGIIALTFGILLYRRSKKGRARSLDNMETYPQAKHQIYDVTPWAHSYNGFYKPTVLESTGRGAELDARLGHRFAPGAFSLIAKRW
ncbi:hypothetical protein F5Y06DRAFT_207111 [Hypoxylon sp. FL0890]|nr:hypothetical protein F5Y06DRAFT_207111 [Hypoxylon sp. FL0890]